MNTVIGVTGNISAGKTHACSMLQQLAKARGIELHIINVDDLRREYKVEASQTEPIITKIISGLKGTILLEWAMLAEDGLAELTGNRFVLLTCNKQTQSKRLSNPDIPMAELNRRIKLQPDNSSRIKTLTRLAAVGGFLLQLDTSHNPTETEYSVLLEQLVNRIREQPMIRPAGCLFRIPAYGKRVIWEITNTCNYSCSYCMPDAGKGTREPATKEIINMASRMQKQGYTHIKLTGGEPFIRKDIFEILTVFKQLGFYVDVSTNASLITRASAQQLQQLKIDLVHVSLDGHNKRIHESLRGKGTFASTVRGIKHLVQAEVPVRIGCVIHSDNQNELPAIARYCHDLGVSNLVFSLLEPAGRLKKDNPLLADRSISSLKSELDELKLQYSLPEENNSSCKAECPGGDRFLYIDNLGKVAPCTWVAQKSNNYSCSKLPADMQTSKRLSSFRQLAGRAAVCPARHLKELEYITSLVDREAFEQSMTKAEKFGRFAQVYPFATENIAGYYPAMDFADKSVLCVGGSGDHLINALMAGAQHVTCFDINYLARYYAELKLAALQTLEYQAFLKFFRQGRDTFSYTRYLELKDRLSPMAAAFWDRIFALYAYSGQQIRKSALFCDKYKLNPRTINLYLSNSSKYNRAATTLQSDKYNWQSSWLQEQSGEYDIVLLSNISDYIHKKSPTKYLIAYKKLLSGIRLKPHGLMAFAYLYDVANKKLRNQLYNPAIRQKLFGNKKLQYKELTFASVIQDKQDAVAIVCQRTRNSLVSDSTVYAEQAPVYDKFAQAEDYPGEVLNALLPMIQGKSLLDAGCGTGKYLQLLAGHANQIIGVDISEKQLAVARNRGLKNIKLLQTDASHLPFTDKSIDLVLGCWFISTIVDEQKRLQVIRELQRVGKQVVLVENDEGGEFEELRSATTRKGQRTRELNNWIKKTGFKAHRKLKTYFQFTSCRESKKVTGQIYGQKVAKQVYSKTIGHNVIIFVTSPANRLTAGMR